jgi:shikimate kinase
MCVADLFQLHGEKSFRDGEAKVIKRLLKGPPHVLATGGGAVTHPATRKLISKEAISIWIRAETDTIVRRATRRGTRPLLKTGDPQETIERLLDERREFYASADIHIDSQPGPHENTVMLILEKLENWPGLLATREDAFDD